MDRLIQRQAFASHAEFSINDLKARHREFLSRSWKEVAPAEIEEAITRTYGELALVIFHVNSNSLSRGPLYRARWLDNRKEDISSWKTFSYPAAPEKQLLGRANLPGHPIFYTCGDPLLAVREAKRDGLEGTSLYRSEWRFTNDDPWRIVSMIDPVRIKEIGNTFHTEWEGGMREYILGGGSAPPEYLIQLHACIAELFLTKNYEVTAWIADRIFDHIRGVDAIIYPSAAGACKDICHAFRPQPIDEGRIALTKVARLTREKGKTLLREEGRPRKGYIQWKPIVPPQIEI